MEMHRSIVLDDPYLFCIWIGLLHAFIKRHVIRDTDLWSLKAENTPACSSKRSYRRILWLTLSRPERLSAEQTQELAQVCALSAQISTGVTLAQAFVTMLREKRVEDLPAWLERAQASSLRELHQFAQGIERDRAAVEAAFSSQISQGQTKGHVTRSKLIKRQMYGQARFDLLRLRIIHAA